MKYYLMARKVTENSTLLDQMSHELTEFSTGDFLPDDFQEPLICALDEDFINGQMATFYMDPAVIGTRKFYKDLQEIGVNNIETKAVIIQDNVNHRVHDDYLLLNIIGRVACADMSQSDYHALGEGINVINTLVIDASKTQGQEFFLIDEDTDCIVVSERIYKHLQSKGYPDLYFEELRQV